MNPLIGAALISGGFQLGGDLLGGFFGSKGASSANNLNYQMFRENQEFQKEVMSKRHQWEVSDLKAAGLNPILSANTAGSVPGSSYAAPINVNEPVARGFASSAGKLSELAFNLMRGMQKKGSAEADTADFEKRFQEATLDERIDAARESFKTEQYKSRAERDGWGRLMYRLGQGTSAVGKVFSGSSAYSVHEKK